jgi:hypothetical protein
MTDAIITYVVAYVIVWIFCDGWHELVPAVAITWSILAALQYMAP